tara:strand:- start:895 stop:3150 length:2256 start_codon:yes stop_codon:yes gene_type:complete
MAAITETFIEIRAELDGLRSDLNQANKMLGGIGKGVSLTSIGTSITGLLSGINLIGIAAKGIVAPFKIAFKVITKVVQVAVGIIKKVIGGIVSVAKMVGRALKNAFSFGKEYIKGAINVAKEFSVQMSAVGALTESVGTKSFTVLREKALELGRSTEFSATQAAMGMANFARTGQSTKEILQSIAPTLDFATANFLDLNTASDIAARVMGGMGLKANEVTRAMDAMTVGANKSNQNVSDLGEAMKNVGASAKAADLSIEQTVATMMAFADVGRRGGEAGTALKQILLKMPSRPAQKFLDSIGVSARDAATGGFKPLADIIDDMNRSMSGMDEFTKLEKIIGAFGTRAGPGLVSLLDAGGDSIRKYTKLIEDNAGMSARNAEIQRKSLANSFKIVASAADDLRIRLVDVLEPLIRGANEKAVQALNYLSSFVKEKGPEIRDYLVGAFGQLKDGVIDALTVTVGFISLNFDTIMNKANSLKNAFKSAGSGIKDAFASFFGQDLVKENTGPLERTVLAFQVAFLKIEMGFRQLMEHLISNLKGISMAMFYVTQQEFSKAGAVLASGFRGEAPGGQSEEDRKAEYDERLAKIVADVAAMSGIGGSEGTMSARERGQQVINETLGIMRDAVLGAEPEDDPQSRGPKPVQKVGPGFLGDFRSHWEKFVDKMSTKYMKKSIALFEDHKKLGLFAPTDDAKDKVNPAASASAFRGTIDTVFGAMKFGKDNQVKLLEDIKKINTKISNNTKTGAAGGAFT